ncbi:hypothetical protein WBJ53_28100 [Spirosoma sp. SC4-14]|uniref:hypothetical protein n=1 Tax=Spirosoma sp. SC4-14 TaxID=3128900 RepID=UPI0030D292A7
MNKYSTKYLMIMADVHTPAQRSYNRNVGPDEPRAKQRHKARTNRPQISSRPRFPVSATR